MLWPLKVGMSLLKVTMTVEVAGLRKKKALTSLPGLGLMCKKNGMLHF